jgi:Txe/YoeB family toxin of Txe-Axe toxin-antitoxin module
VASRRRRRLDIRPTALADIAHLALDDARLPKRINTLFGRLVRADIAGEALSDMPRYGNLTDCYKIYFGIPGRPQNTHRIVYRLRAENIVDFIEVVAVEERDGGYVYLTVADRLGRLPPESRTAFMSQHQKRIARRGAQKGRSSEPT